MISLHAGKYTQRNRPERAAEQGLTRLCEDMLLKHLMAQSLSHLVSCPRNTCMFRRRSVGCFSRRSEPDWRYRRAYLDSIREDPPRRRKNSQLAAAPRGKMGRRLRCSSVTYRFKIRALPAAHFDRNETCTYFGDRTLVSRPRNKH